MVVIPFLWWLQLRLCKLIKLPQILKCSFFIMIIVSCLFICFTGNLKTELLVYVKDKYYRAFFLSVNFWHHWTILVEIQTFDGTWLSKIIHVFKFLIIFLSIWTSCQKCTGHGRLTQLPDTLVGRRISFPALLEWVGFLFYPESEVKQKFTKMYRENELSANSFIHE